MNEESILRERANIEMMMKELIAWHSSQLEEEHAEQSEMLRKLICLEERTFNPVELLDRNNRVRVALLNVERETCLWLTYKQKREMFDRLQALNTSLNHYLRYLSKMSG